jgi:hypothetical protein
MNITQRKQLRQSIRNYLGVSRDPAPDTLYVLKAARDMASLLDLTSGGRFGLALVDFRGDGGDTQSSYPSDVSFVPIQVWIDEMALRAAQREKRREIV